MAKKASAPGYVKPRMSDTDMADVYCCNCNIVSDEGDRSIGLEVCIGDDEWTTVYFCPRCALSVGRAVAAAGREPTP